jgi:hypothetical protein
MLNDQSSQLYPAKGVHKYVVVRTHLANPRPQVKGSVVKTFTLSPVTITFLSEIRTHFSCRDTVAWILRNLFKQPNTNNNIS